MRKYLFIIILLMPCSAAIAQFESAFLYPYPKRYVLLDSVGNVFYRAGDSSKVFAANQRLRRLGRMHHDEKAILIADELDLDYRLRVELPRYTPLPKVSAALIQRAGQLDFPAMEALVNVITGFYYYNHKEYAVGFNYLLKGYDKYKNLSTDEFPSKAYVLYDLAMCYYKFGDYQHAIQYASMAVGLKTRHPHTVMFNYDVLAAAYMEKGAYDSARKYFQATYDAALAVNKSRHTHLGWPGIALGNMGQSWYLQKQYAKAIPLLEQGIAITGANGLWDNTAGFTCALAGIYLAENQPDSIPPLIEQARNATYKSSDQGKYSLLYNLMADYYKSVGDHKKAIIFRDSFIYWNELLEHQLNLNIKTRVELSFTEDKYKIDKQLLQSELKLQSVIRNSLFAVIFLGVIITLILVRNRQQKLERREAAMRQEIDDRERALVQAKEELTRFAQNIQEKNAIIEALEAIHQEQQVAMPVTHVDAIDNLRRSVILTEAGWEEFRKNFEIVYPGFIAETKTRHPDCTASEYRMIILEKLQLSNKEMASMLGVSQETIRSTKSRLRKKLAS